MVKKLANKLAFSTNRENNIKVAEIHAADNNKRIQLDSIKNTRTNEVQLKDSDTRKLQIDELVRSNMADETIKRQELGIKSKEVKIKNKDSNTKSKIANQKPKK